MARVICTLPNASEEISGVKFTPHEHGMQSEDITLAQAAAFIEIRGYQLVDAEGRAEVQAAAVAPVPVEVLAPAAPAPVPVDQAQADADARAKDQAQAEEQRQAAEAEARELAALVDEAKALGIEVKGTWRHARLKAEIKRAKEEKAAADAAAATAAGEQGKSE